MPWFETAVYINPADQAVAELRSVPHIRDHLYCVHDLSDHQWNTDDARHKVPPSGLAVIRTIGDPDNDLEQNDVSWNDTPNVGNQGLQISPSIPRVVDFMGEELCPSPPSHFLDYLKYLSLSHAATVVFYSGSSWGGPIEYEFAWIFKPDESVYCLDDPSAGYRQYFPNSAMQVCKGEIQQVVMSHLGIELPTPYCAFFDSSLDWDRFKVMPHAT